jgi:hypothetical protein
MSLLKSRGKPLRNNCDVKKLFILGHAYGLERMRKQGIIPRGIWRRICSDIFSCRIVTLAKAERTALGVAIQALAAVETEKSTGDWSGNFAKINAGEITELCDNIGFDYAVARQRHNVLTRALAHHQFLHLKPDPKTLCD